MSDLEYRQQRVVELLLEDESLTAELVDEAARSLLDWGVAQAETIAQQAEELSQDEISARLATLRHAMKHISKQAGEAASEAQAEQVRILLADTEAERVSAAEQGRRTRPDAEYYLEVETDE